MPQCEKKHTTVFTNVPEIVLRRKSNRRKINPQLKRIFEMIGECIAAGGYVEYEQKEGFINATLVWGE